MKGKILILLVMFVFLFASGCTEKDAAVPDDSNTSIPKAGEAVQQEKMSLLNPEIILSAFKIMES
ncbi:MAG: hypothetical protein NHB15_08095 [Methanosarcina barkeri]|nr:hypothetical protein [Methanosarcina sp. ERenArc_MAG2]